MDVPIWAVRWNKISKSLQFHCNLHLINKKITESIWFNSVIHCRIGDTDLLVIEFQLIIIVQVLNTSLLYHSGSVEGLIGRVFQGRCYVRVWILGVKYMKGSALFIVIQRITSPVVVSAHGDSWHWWSIDLFDDRCGLCAKLGSVLARDGGLRRSVPR